MACCSSTSGKKGNKWEFKIKFINNSDAPTECVDGNEMEKKIGENGLSEIITKVYYCTFPLSKYQLTWFYCHHAIIVCQTKNWFYSLEKNGTAIWIQKDKQFTTVNFTFRGEERKTLKLIKEMKNTNCTIGDLKRFIDEKELNNPYYYSKTKQNCKGFAERIYKYASTNDSTDFLNLRNLILVKWKFKKIKLQEELLNFMTKDAIIVLEMESEKWLIEIDKSKLAIQKSEEINHFKVSKPQDKISCFEYSSNSSLDRNDLKEGSFSFTKSKNVPKYADKIKNFLHDNNSHTYVNDSKILNYSWNGKGFGHKLIDFFKSEKFVKFKTADWNWSVEIENSDIWIQKSKQPGNVSEHLGFEIKRKLSMLKNLQNRGPIKAD